MTCGIYMIQNKVNNKIYIGQAVDIKERWGKHKSYLKANCNKPNKHLQNAWNKYGEDNFEFTVICECEENQLNTLEEYYIFELMSYDRRVGYNKTYGGDSGRPSEEAKQKQSEAMKGENNPWYGKHFTEEHRNNISKSLKGRIFSEEHRNKISESRKGITFSEGHRNKLSESHKGKTLSKETREKLSEANKGENNPGYGKHGAENPNSIPVVQLTHKDELVKVYESATEAGRNGFTQSSITRCLKGRRKTHGGYKWMYLSDYEAMKKEG